MATISKKPSKLPFERRALRVLMMVHELHKAGYQRLRIAPGLSASGCHWRCAITPVSSIMRSHGAKVDTYGENLAHYTSGQENEYFDWKDAKTDTARDLAEKFIKRFPAIVRMSLGQDWEYAGWYVQMLGLAEKGEFPIAYADWYDKPDPRWLPTTKGFDSGLPMPPGGEGRKAKPGKGD
jgi:hypothetical protein